MSSLRSALDELRAEDLGSLSDAALAGHLDEIERAGRILEAERARAVIELERRTAWKADGQLSAAAWLAHRQGMSRRSAEAAVRRARALETMPEVARAFGEGEVPPRPCTCWPRRGRRPRRRSNDTRRRCSRPLAR